jgi:hypothetical protein
VKRPITGGIVPLPEPPSRPGSLPGREGHWLLFDMIDHGRLQQRVVSGCHCGFKADVEADCGWGDSVVEHLIDVGRSLA